MKEKESIQFTSIRNKNAHKAWLKALEILGGTMLASKKTKIAQCKLSQITNGYPTYRSPEAAGMRKQSFPTLIEAIKISLAVEGQVKAEELLPFSDYKILYKYFNRGEIS